MTQADHMAEVADSLSDPPADRKGVFGWIMFDAAMQPWFTLVTTFVFGPYVVSALAASPAEGQALWGYAAGFAGLTIALLSPPLGAIADAAGPRKPWIALLGLIMAICAIGLWFAEPRVPYGLTLALILFAVGTVAAEMAGVFNNAMMPTLVPADRLGRLSAHGWAAGYCAAVVTILIAIGLLVGSPETGRTILGLEPLFGLDASAREGDRAVGPFTAIWFAVLVLPLMVFTPDRPTMMPMSQAIGQGLADLREGLAALRGEKPLTTFLIAHMIYADGLVALFAFGGIYGTGVFGWTITEVGLFGILLTITGTIGALIGGPLEDKVGAKPVILTSLGVLTLASLSVVSLSAETMFFVIPVSPADGLFATTPEKLYLVLGGLMGAAAGPLQASSRALLARLAPPHARARTFGLFALSGKVTSFVGPWAVATVTALTMDQRAGISVLILFFVAGGALLLQVRVRERAM
ncbi:MFS transporter [Ahrensia marina]|uniref:MFS transporter n=1 Tax=Ahrensia marina TaxID=1514904 RepID=UPI0035D020B3